MSGSEKCLFLWLDGFEENRLFTADVQNDAHSPSRMHAVVLSIDQRPCQWYSAECFPTYQWLAASSRWCRNFTSEQNKVSKSEVVEKVIPVSDFWMSKTLKTIGVPIVTGLPRLPTVCQRCTNRQKQSKDSQNSKNDHWCTNRHRTTNSVYQQCTNRQKQSKDSQNRKNEGLKLRG